MPAAELVEARENKAPTLTNTRTRPTRRRTAAALAASALTRGSERAWTAARRLFHARQIEALIEKQKVVAIARHERRARILG